MRKALVVDSDIQEELSESLNVKRRLPGDQFICAKLSQRAFCHAVQLDVLIDFMCHLLIRLLGRVNTVKNVLPDVVELGIASAM